MNFFRFANSMTPTNRIMKTLKSSPDSVHLLYSIWESENITLCNISQKPEQCPVHLKE